MGIFGYLPRKPLYAEGMKQKEKESSGDIENPKVSVSDLAERRALLRVRLFLVVNQKIDDGRKKAKRKTSRLYRMNPCPVVNAFQIPAPDPAICGVVDERKPRVGKL